MAMMMKTDAAFLKWDLIRVGFHLQTRAFNFYSSHIWRTDSVDVWFCAALQKRKKKRKKERLYFFVLIICFFESDQSRAGSAACSPGVSSSVQVQSPVMPSLD